MKTVMYLTTMFDLLKEKKILNLMKVFESKNFQRPDIHFFLKQCDSNVTVSIM